MARVILDTRAEAERLEHLQIVVRTHLKTLRLEQLPFRFELLQTIIQLVTDGQHSVVKLCSFGHIMRCGPNRHNLIRGELFARHEVEFDDALDLVAPHLHPNWIIRIWREYVERIAAHAERSPLEFVIVTVVLDIDQFVDEIVPRCFLLDVEEHCHARIFRRRADAVDARDARNDDAVAP